MLKAAKILRGPSIIFSLKFQRFNFIHTTEYSQKYVFLFSFILFYDLAIDFTDFK